MHRGQLVQKIVIKSGIPVATLVKRIGISRTSYYNHINDQNLKLDIIAKYGKALGYDFSINIPQLNDVNNFITKTPVTLEQAIVEIDYWKEKYFEVLEKYNSSMEERLLKRE